MVTQLTLEEVLQKPIQKVIESQHLYSDSSQKITDEAARDASQELPRQEHGHQQLLEQYLRGELREGTLSSEQVIDYKIAERLDQPEISPDMKLRDVTVSRREVLLTKVGVKYYAANNRCPHMGGKLSRDELEGTIVTRPLHGSQFDLKSGEVVRWLKGSGLLSKVGKALKSPRQLTTYNVNIEDDRIPVEV